LKPYLKQGEAVTIESGTYRNVRLNLIPASRQVP
jgi:hypothetical protein